MQVAGIDLYVNHPVMAVGPTEWIPTTLALNSEPAAACDTHLIVRVQAQTVLVKVRIFKDHGDSDGQGRDLESLTTVFDGHLLLSDGRLVVGTSSVRAGSLLPCSAGRAGGSGCRSTTRRDGLEPLTSSSVPRRCDGAVCRR